MNHSHAFLFSILFAFTSAALTACGGSDSNSSPATDHPKFNRAKVAVSNFYQPTGIIHDSSPTFSWKATTNATNYRFGLENTLTEENWQEYTITSATANCATGNKCSYTPNDIQLVDGDEKVWWVQAKVASQWKGWSKAFVFQYVDDSNTQTEASPITPVGVITTTNPDFIWSVANGADSYQFGFESIDESDWKSYYVTATQANCQANQCSFTPADSQLENNDEKTWWVRSQTNGIWSNWSNGSQFFINVSSSNERPLIIKINSHITTCQPPNGCHSTEKFTITAGAINNGQQYDYNVDCDSDGINEATHRTGTYTCTYNTAGEYRVTLSGHFPHIKTRQVTAIEQWGTQQWSSMESSFTNAKNLKISAVDNPDLSQVTSTANMFFRGSFDPDLNNQNVSNWDVSNITDMNNMFREARKFNQYIGNWDVSNVTNMDLMFFAANDFNQDIGNWDVGNVTNMHGMFMAANNFNQDIGNWNTSSLIEIKDMFNHALNFNQPIGNWDVSNISDMERLFSGAESFNQSVDNWNVSNVTNMNSLFSHATAFNQSLANWDVSKVTNMSYMFNYATSFNQDISNWDVSNVEAVGYKKGMVNLLTNTSLSTQNYDNLLMAWSTLPLLNNVRLDIGNTKYSSSSSAARQQIIDNFNWQIHDGGEL